MVPIHESYSLNAIETKSTPLCQALALCACTSCKHWFLEHGSSEKDVESHLNPSDPLLVYILVSYLESSAPNSLTASALTMFARVLCFLEQQVQGVLPP